MATTKGAVVRVETLRADRPEVTVLKAGDKDAAYKDIFAAAELGGCHVVVTTDDDTGLVVSVGGGGFCLEGCSLRSSGPAHDRQLRIQPIVDGVSG